MNASKKYEEWHQSNFDRPMNWCGVPEYMREGVSLYLLYGRIPGHFLSAIFSNDLMKALSRADDNNINCLKNYGQLLYNHVPASSYGSEEAFKGWIEIGGLLKHERVSTE